MREAQQKNKCAAFDPRPDALICARHVVVRTRAFSHEREKKQKEKQEKEQKWRDKLFEQSNEAER